MATDPRGGHTSQGRDHVQPLDPGGGAVSTVSPQRMITDDVFQTVEQSSGGSLLAPPGALAECTERTMAEDTHGRECPHDDDFGLRPRTRTIGISEDGVPIRNIQSPYGGGVWSLPGATGNCLPVMVPTAPLPPANGTQLGSWRVAVVRVEETPAGDASGSEFPCAETDRQRPIDLPEVAGNVFPVLLAAAPPPPPRAGLVNFVWPCWPVFTRGEETGTIRAYGSYKD